MRSIIASCVRVLVATAFLAVLSLSQPQSERARLEITLPKKKYLLHERISVRYRIKNLSSSLLCFPPPAVDCYSIDGELGVEAIPPKGTPRPKIGYGCAADRLMDRDAVYDIDRHWIKLRPGQSYEIAAESHSVALSAPGRWTIEGGYVPMREDTLSMYKNAMKERGCIGVPQLHSGQLEINVRNKS